LLITINTTDCYVLPDESHGYMFRPLGGHLQAAEVHKDKMTIAGTALCTLTA